MNKREIGSRYESMAREGRFLVFIEVKYRRDTREGDPGEAISPLKQQRIRKAALVYLYEHRLPMDIPCRFDVVTILGKEIRLIRDAF